MYHCQVSFQSIYKSSLSLCKPKVLLSTLLLLLGAHLYGQTSRSSQYYTFQKDSGTFVIMDPAKMESVNQGDVWVEDTSFGIPIGFQFHFLDHNLNHLRINQSNLYLPERDYYITAFGNFIMGDRGDTLSLSPITYLLDSSGSSKILKIQWLNAGFDFDTSMFINFQVWLYQNSNMIEIRYGKSHINMAKSQVHNCGPLVGLAKLDTLTEIELYELDLAGKAAKPYSVTLKDTGRRCLNNVPAEGTIYRFSYHDVSGILPLHSALSAFVVYPNPTSGKLNINLPSGASGIIKVSDINGAELMKKSILSGAGIDLSCLPNGIYLLTVIIDHEQHFEKIVICR